MAIQFRCTGCGRTLSIEDKFADSQIRCPACQQIVAIPQEKRTPAPIAQHPAESAERLPITMLANKLVAGRTCPGCRQAISLGQQVRNCQDCGASHHQSCWERLTGCGTTNCPGAPKTATRAGSTVRPEIPEGPRQPCRACGEAILATALRCPFCGEAQREFRVSFLPGRKRVFKHDAAEIRRKDGVIRIGKDTVDADGMGCMPQSTRTLITVGAFCVGSLIGACIASYLLENVFLQQRVLSIQTDSVIEILFDRKRKKVIICFKSMPGQRRTTCLAFTTKDIELLIEALKEVVGAEKFIEVEFDRYPQPTADNAFIAGLLSVLLPIPVLGGVFAIIGLVLAIQSLLRGKSGIGIAGLVLGAVGLIGDVLMMYLIISS